MCGEPCSEAATLSEIKTDVKWIKESLEKREAETKNIGLYKKITWVNFLAILGGGLWKAFGGNI